MPKKSRISLSIDPSLLRQLEEYCKKEKRSLSNATELALEEFLRTHTEGSISNVES